MSVYRFILVLPFFLVLAACGGGGSGSTPSSNPTSSCSTSSTGNIALDGQIKFEQVPHNSYGLDYAASYNAPARGVTVQAINTDNNTVVASTSTDASGNYDLSVPNNTMIKMRVLAQLSKTDALPKWNFSVKDNTNGNAIYALEGSASCTGTSNETRNLTATSGWTGSSYTETRSAAPFSILDTVYEGIQLIKSVKSDINFPSLSLYWSINNTDTFGNTAQGQIGTTYFDGSNAIYILGDQDVDTDEYDPSVIAHEWGHYIEANFSRSDSIGGYHSSGDYLDMRVAFGEGFGNAFSSMVRNDPQYIDSSGPQQASGFGFNVESETSPNPGWYSETSVEKILYDLYDTNNSPNDTDPDYLSMGFQPIWDVLINQERTDPAFTSIFKFIDILKIRNPSEATNIDTLVNAQNIHVLDEYGSGETNNTSRNNSDLLPIYDVVPTSTTSVCVTNAFRRSIVTNFNDALTYNYNVLGMHHYLRFTPSSDGTYTFTVSGPSSGDPDAYFYIGNSIHRHESYNAGSETFPETLTGGQEYVFDIDDYNILSNFTSDESRCYSVSVVAN